MIPNPVLSFIDARTKENQGRRSDYLAHDIIPEFL
jgi:hypothetical protein